jgi:NADP+-dependent farnesol dehydrogenase
MEKWLHKTAVVTGANYGNGNAILRKLSEHDINVVGIDIVTGELEELRSKAQKLNIHALKCDVTRSDDTERAFKWIEESFGGIDILINNAGTFRNVGILEHDKPMAELEHLIDLNLTAVVRCSRLAYKSMVLRDAHGYIININSIHGHSVSEIDRNVQMGVYPATKYGVTAATEVMRRELVNAGSRKIRVTSLSPGLVRTHIFKAAGFSQEVEDSCLANPYIFPEDIGDNVVHLLSTPSHVNISEMTIRPTGGNI